VSDGAAPLIIRPAVVRRRRVNVQNLLPAAVVAIVLFFPTGIPAFVAAWRSRRAAAAGEVEEARGHAERARNLVWYSVGLGLTVGAIAFFIVLLTNNNGAVRQGFFSGRILWESAPAVLKGFKTNVSLFVITEIIVLVWALVIAIVRSIPGPAAAPVRFLAVAYTDIFRGLPAIIVIYVVHFGLKRAGLPYVKDFSDYQSGVFALTLVYGAYVSEVYRAGIESIHWSQVAAARSLGLSFAGTMRYVVVPQAVRRMVPPLLNDFIGLQKDTALVSILGTLEAFNRAKNYATLHSANLSPITGVAICYVVITIPLARFTDWLVRRDQAKMRVNA
jgi:polar amino acid transport system permease protein